MESALSVVAEVAVVVVEEQAPVAQEDPVLRVEVDLVRLDLKVNSITCTAMDPMIPLEATYLIPPLRVGVVEFSNINLNSNSHNPCLAVTQATKYRWKMV